MDVAAAGTDSDTSEEGEAMVVETPAPGVEGSGEMEGGEPEIEGGDSESGLDLKKTAEEYARYLVVNSKHDKQQLDERIENVVFRVEEFKRQLDWMHQNIASSSSKTQELHEHTQQLGELFQRIDQVEAFVTSVSRNMDVLEETISKAERAVDPSKLRKVLFSLRKTTQKDQTTAANWQPPPVFKTKDYFAPQHPQLRELEETSPPPAAAERPLAS